MENELGREREAARLSGPGRVDEVAEPDRTPSATILLVEDNAQLRRLAAMILAGVNYTILEAEDGGEALRLAERHSGPIDLLLSDVVMPELSGPVLAEELRPIHPETRVLYVSGHCDSRLAAQFDTPVDIMLKPYLPDELLERVRAALAASRA